MSDKEAEVVENQRRRRKRIGRIKTGIILIVSGWILISMILIIVLFVKLNSIEHKLDKMITSNTQEMNQDINLADLSVGEMGTETIEETEQTEIVYEAAIPLASGIEDEMNLASENDLHKVYLTFDDGPSENTGEILDILKEYDVKATFFVTGKEDEESKALYQRIVDEGHTLGMHSYSNKYSVIYQSDEAFETDFYQLRDYLQELTGVESIYYRFPGGSNNQISNVPMSNFIHFLNKEGCVYFDWNVSSGDATSNAYSADEIVANVTNDVVKYKTSVVLLHDSSEKDATIEALEPLLEALKEMNAEILPIDEDTSVIQYVKAESID